MPIGWAVWVVQWEASLGLEEGIHKPYGLAVMGWTVTFQPFYALRYVPWEEWFGRIPDMFLSWSVWGLLGNLPWKLNIICALACFVNEVPSLTHNLIHVSFKGNILFLPLTLRLEASWQRSVPVKYQYTSIINTANKSYFCEFVLESHSCHVYEISARNFTHMNKLRIQLTRCLFLQ